MLPTRSRSDPLRQVHRRVGDRHDVRQEREPAGLHHRLDDELPHQQAAADEQDCRIQGVSTPVGPAVLLGDGTERE
jgi:hypothetical protein